MEKQTANLSQALEAIDEAFQKLKNQAILTNMASPQEPRLFLAKDTGNDGDLELPWLKRTPKIQDFLVNPPDSELQAINAIAHEVERDYAIMDTLLSYENNEGKLTIPGSLYRIRRCLHNLSQPLAAVSLRLELLCEDLPPDNPALRELQDMKQDMEQILDLIADIQFLSRQATRIA